MAVPHVGSRTEPRVRLVEEVDCATTLSRVKPAAQVLLGFAEMLADHLRKVDSKQVELNESAYVLKRRDMSRPAECCGVTSGSLTCRR